MTSFSQYSNPSSPYEEGWQQRNPQEERWSTEEKWNTGESYPPYTTSSYASPSYGETYAPQQGYSEYDHSSQHYSPYASQPRSYEERYYDNIISMDEDIIEHNEWGYGTESSFSSDSSWSEDNFSSSHGFASHGFSSGGLASSGSFSDGLPSSGSFSEGFPSSGFSSADSWADEESGSWHTDEDSLSENSLSEELEKDLDDISSKKNTDYDLEDSSASSDSEESTDDGKETVHSQEKNSDEQEEEPSSPDHNSAEAGSDEKKAPSSFRTHTPEKQLEKFLSSRRVKKQVGAPRPLDRDGEMPENYRVDTHHHGVDPRDDIDRENNPIHEWGWYERRPQRMALGVSETLFALSNGYLGMRGNPEEGRDSAVHGTYINGLHETWGIQHAEDAYGLAREGQTIIQAPDAKAIRLYIDDEPLRLGNADISDFERSIDFREGVLRRSFEWRTPAGKRVRIRTERMVSFEQRHLALMSLDVELLDSDAAVVISSQILNRQDGEDEFHDRAQAQGGQMDPRKAEKLHGRVLRPTYQSHIETERAVLGYQVANSGMTVACGMDHELSIVDGGDSAESYDVEIKADVQEDVARVVYHLDGRQGMRLRLEKFVSYHSSRHVAAEELAFRCARTINRAKSVGFHELVQQQRDFLEDFWERSDVRIHNQPVIQQAVRWNLFQLLQASARAETQGIPAKGMTGSGYGGHYFWDTEAYVMPFLCYTNPEFARNALRFRYDMLPAARERARELSHDGVLFPWRTINGRESSAYYAAGTAQYHIDADIAYALMKYVYATGDQDFLLDEGIHILIGTARFWMSLGFFNEAAERFEIHSVTGPDEYTTVVNNNLYTNVMARYNLQIAESVITQMRRDRPEDFADLAAQAQLTDEELALWKQAAEQMYIPFNKDLGINPQDDQFLQRQLWNMDDPAVGPKRPLLLHYHPLTIYRYQILKQADVVLALFLQGQEFSEEVKRRDYNYYDRLTTGDSTLSAVVQSIMAAELGYGEKALDFFYKGLFVDLADMHGNTSDGVHIASCGGVWGALVSGFGGFRDHCGRFSIDPRLPEGWDSLEFSITLHGNRLQVTVREGEVELAVVEGGHKIGPIWVMGDEVIVGREPVLVFGDTSLSRSSGED